jgi:hypothetical protein
MDKAGQAYRLEHLGRRFRWVDEQGWPMSPESPKMSEAKRWAVAHGWFVMN